MVDRVYSRNKREEQALASQQGVDVVDQDVDIKCKKKTYLQPTHATLPGRPLARALARHVNHVKYCRINVALGEHKPNDSF